MHALFTIISPTPSIIHRWDNPFPLRFSWTRRSACEGGSWLHGATASVLLALPESTTTVFLSNSVHATGTLGRHNIHESKWICLVSPDLAINHNLTLHQDWNNFTIGQSILQPVREDKDQRQALPGFVGTRWRLGCKCSTKLVNHPMLQAAIPPYFFSTKACDEKKVIEHTKVIEDTGMTHPLLLRKAFFPSNR